MKSNSRLLISLLYGLLAFHSVSTAEGDEENVEHGEGDSCQEEIIHSYRLFPYRPDKPKEKNYLCPELKNDCCSFNSQKLIQVLWARQWLRQFQDHSL